MVKVIVLINFNDKNTGKAYKKGDVIELAPERFNEIIKKGNYVELYVEKPTAKGEIKK